MLFKTPRLLVALALVFGSVFAASTARAGICNCYWPITHDYTCSDSASGCTQTIQVDSCGGIKNNCGDCTSAAFFIPCCGHEIGTSQSFGTCQNRAALSVAGLTHNPDNLPVYVPSCGGGFVVFLPAETR